MSLTETPRSNQLHIGIFGKRNSGKSSLINALTGQEVAIVSDVAGTTADPVYKTMEIHGIGPCVFIDTAGFDDVGELGQMRVDQTRKALEKTDIALIVCADEELKEEITFAKEMEKKQIPYLVILNKSDTFAKVRDVQKKLHDKFGVPVIPVSARDKNGMEQVRQAIMDHMPSGYERESIVGDLVDTGDLVLLVMPQDIQAPKGRLILPQVQIMRDLLDKHALVMSCTTDQLDATLLALSHPPKMIITDSQVFDVVYQKKPKESALSSFSVLFAQYKGDIDYFIKGAAAIERLTEQSHVLIAEACTHAPLSEDIGREKLPRFLRKKVGEGLQVTVVSGSDFPEELTEYDLIIHCGACMFNRRYVQSRVESAREQGVPMTNYGVALAYLKGILDKVVW